MVGDVAAVGAAVLASVASYAIHQGILVVVVDGVAGLDVLAVRDLCVGHPMVEGWAVLGAPVGHWGATGVGQLMAWGVGLGRLVGQLTGAGGSVAGWLVGHTLLSSPPLVASGVFVGHRGAGGRAVVAPVGHTAGAGVGVFDFRDSVGQTSDMGGRVGRPVGHGKTRGGLAVRPVGHMGCRVVGGVGWEVTEVGWAVGRAVGWVEGQVAGNAEV